MARDPLQAMTYAYVPDHSVPPGETLREFIDRWQEDPAAAIECATQGYITAARAQELIIDAGEPWSIAEAIAVGMVMGPSLVFWQKLVRLHKEHVRQQSESGDSHQPEDGDSHPE